jgi:hypothetical protein
MARRWHPRFTWRRLVVTLIAVAALLGAGYAGYWLANDRESSSGSATPTLDEQAAGGPLVGGIRGARLGADAPLETPYNIVTRGSDDLFIYGGGYGDNSAASGSFVASVEPATLRERWRRVLINTNATDE